MNYDKFQVGDKVWSEAHGFGEIIHEDTKVKRFYFNAPTNSGDWVTCEGSLATARTRPRTFFYAVADTDEGMREAIARGEGFMRPVPRGRWEIQPGDRAIVFCAGLGLEFNVGKVLENKSSDSYVLAIPYISSFTISGKSRVWDIMPRAMRLYDGEEPFEDPCENMRWMMDEAIKFGWHEKYGKK